MSCKGLKGLKYKKCMKAYVKESTRTFPTFNQNLDTVITTKGTGSRSAIKNANRLKTSRYNSPGLNSQRTVSYTDGTTVSSSITKKKK